LQETMRKLRLRKKPQQEVRQPAPTKTTDMPVAKRS
jgi:hypothetical protein